MALLKEGVRYVIFNYLSVFLNTVRGIVLIAVLTPIQMGSYRLIFTYSNYFRYYNLGLNALAFYRAPPRKLQALYSNLLFKINISLAAFFGILFSVAYTFLASDEYSSLWLASIFLFVILFFTQTSETFVTIAKIHGRFDIINRYNIAFASGSLVLMIVLGKTYGLHGAIGGLALATMATSLYLSTVLKDAAQSSVTLTFNRIKLFFLSGALNIFPGMLSILFSTIEVWLITRSFGLAETGYYSVVITLVNLILMINTDGFVFLYAKRSKQIKNDPRFVLKSTVLSFGVTLLFCAMCIPIVHWGVAYFFPQYATASDIYQICFWGIPFLVMKNLVVYYLSNNRPIRISVLLALLLVMKTVVLLQPQTTADFYTSVAWSNVVFGVAIAIIFIIDNNIIRRNNIPA
ncbi:MATE family efflux transporter [Pseudochryseolinea flava]|uniref:Polysaccharide biosynthesis protein n=1 Tax=Pseudochryseolinea flava TaxID=2059302 RepID=A0A364XYZ7_9BACT|nr:hypothetical protein [Pseudochryseolinea flava]RAV99751.1 hypothetical protein DQQ10_17035 [Pseudochryseolinea flava]